MSVLYAGIKRHIQPSNKGPFKAINVHFLPILPIIFPVKAAESKAPIPNNERIQLVSSDVNDFVNVQLFQVIS